MKKLAIIAIIAFLSSLTPASAFDPTVKITSYKVFCFDIKTLTWLYMTVVLAVK